MSDYWFPANWWVDGWFGNWWPLNLDIIHQNGNAVTYTNQMGDGVDYSEQGGESETFETQTGNAVQVDMEG